MTKLIFRRFSKFSSLKKLDERLTLQWDDGASRIDAVKTAQLMSDLLVIRASTVHLSRDFWRISHAAEVLWDSNHLDDARRIVELWRQRVTLACEKRPVDTKEGRIWSAILSARLEHRCRNYGIAVEYANLALSEIRAAAGGERTLHTILKRGDVGPIPEAYCAALAIAIPAGRLHFRHRPALRTQFLDAWINDALLILAREQPPYFRRIHALVIQTFFALAERSWTAERAAWLKRLIWLDDCFRPRNWRGQSTKRLRDVALARFEGDLPGESEAATVAREGLIHLPRHIEVLDGNRWWPTARN